MSRLSRCGTEHRKSCSARGTTRQASTPGLSVASLRRWSRGSRSSPATRRLTKSSGSLGVSRVLAVFMSSSVRTLTAFISCLSTSRPFDSRLLGTPSEEIWPGVTGLPDYKSSFPQWSTKELRTSVNGLNSVSTDLLQVCGVRSAPVCPVWSCVRHKLTPCCRAPTTVQRMLMYDPAKRISAKASLTHPYFAGYVLK